MGCYNEVKLSRTPALPWHTFYSEHKKHQQSNHSYEVQLMPRGEAHRGRGTTKCWQREGQDRRLEATFDWRLRRHGREEWQWVEENFKGSRSTRQPFLVQAIMIGTSGIMIALVLTVASNSYFLSNGFTFLTFNFETIINWHSVVRNNRVSSVFPIGNTFKSILNVITLTDHSYWGMPHVSAKSHSFPPQPLNQPATISIIPAFQQCFVNSHGV